jgi:uncharacterized sulfatase
LNLTPEATFQNGTTTSSLFKSWIAKAAIDPIARKLVYNYQHRPEEELYDVINDPLEMNNLADSPALASIKKELKEKLMKWMEQQGDKGQQTEMEAFEHQTKNRKE